MPRGHTLRGSFFRRRLQRSRGSRLWNLGAYACSNSFFLPQFAAPHCPRCYSRAVIGPLTLTLFWHQSTGRGGAQEIKMTMAVPTQQYPEAPFHPPWDRSLRELCRRQRRSCRPVLLTRSSASLPSPLRRASLLPGLALFSSSRPLVSRSFSQTAGDIDVITNTREEPFILLPCE